MAVFSDVHSNLEALQAVFADMKALGVRRYYCLGDVVGYCADPVACLEAVRALHCPTLKGNHDEAASHDDQIEFSRRSLSDEERAWLADLPLSLVEDGFEFVHASLDEPEKWWYVLSPKDAILHFEAQSQPICFCGHTHNPMLWHFQEAKKLTIRHGEGSVVLPEEEKFLVNVGSVGQPRDLNPNACYALFDPANRRLEFRRIPYNISQAKRKIWQAGLPDYSAERLSLGR